MSDAPAAEPIRPAATTVLLRRTAKGPQVLMGQRGAGAAFMPSKYVFPGGGVDPADHRPLTPGLLADPCLARLIQHLPDPAPSPAALATAALRELQEETGLTLAPAEAPALRFITEVVLAEVTALAAGHPDEGVPFFDNSGQVPTFRRLR